jgi:hypothetical protein
METTEFEFDLATLGDTDRIEECLRDLGTEESPHLLGTLEVKLVGLNSHPLGVIERRVGLDADQQILNARILLAEIMDVVGHDQGKIQFASQCHQLAIHSPLFRQSVIL